MVPLYLPMTLDELDQSAGTPIFFGGINVYLDQKSAWFRNAPAWLHRWLASPALLKWAAGRAARTRAADLGELTLSMMRGHEGNQARELEDLIREFTRLREAITGTKPAEWQATIERIGGAWRPPTLAAVDRVIAALRRGPG